MQPTIAVLATCDTKGEEAFYLKERIRSYGCRCLVIDTGILGDPIKVKPDITKHEVASAASYTIEGLIARGSRGAAVEGIREGVEIVVRRLHEHNKIQGLLAIGGAEGSVIAGAAMDALPLGIPKLTVSPIASGNHKFKEIIHYNDAMVMHSIIDILGINSISKEVFNNAVSAVVGMVKDRYKRKEKAERKKQKRVAISMLGTVTAPIMNYVKPKLTENGYEVITFHANGTGGDCMDNLVREGFFDGVIDYATNELVGINFGGFHVSTKERMEAALEQGIPTIITPGVASILVTTREDEALEKFSNRAKYLHNPEITLFRLNEEEIRIVARTFSQKLNDFYTGNAKFLYPTKGFSSQDKEGKPLYDPEGNKAFLAELKENLQVPIEIIEINAHINDEEFANRVVEEFINLKNKLE